MRGWRGVGLESDERFELSVSVIRRCGISRALGDDPGQQHPSAHSRAFIQDKIDLTPHRSVSPL